MIDAVKMDWKSFTVRLIDALRWPAAFVAVFLIFRLPIIRALAAISTVCGA